MVVYAAQVMLRKRASHMRYHIKRARVYSQLTFLALLKKKFSLLEYTFREKENKLRMYVYVENMNFHLFL